MEEEVKKIEKKNEKTMETTATVRNRKAIPASLKWSKKMLYTVNDAQHC